MSKEKEHSLPIGLWWAQNNLLKDTTHLTNARASVYSHRNTNKIGLGEKYVEGNSEMSETETCNVEAKLEANNGTMSTEKTK